MKDKIGNIKTLLNNENFVVDINNLINKYIIDYRTVNIITLNEYNLSFDTKIKIYEDGMILNTIQSGDFFNYIYIHDTTDSIDISKIKDDMIEYAYNSILDNIKRDKDELNHRISIFEDKFKNLIRIKKLKNIIDEI